VRTTQLMATGRNHVEFVERTLPDRPAAGQLLLRTQATLISAGTELAKIAGTTTHRTSAGDDWHADPLPLGYSSAAVVVAVGDGARGFAVGDRVSAHAPHADHAVVAQDAAALIPAGISDEEATFGTLVPTVLNAVRMGRIALGETCAIVGCGVVGQLALLLARLAGARQVGVVERRDYRRVLALELGAVEAIAPHSDGAPLAFQSFGSGGFDVVIEAAGSASGLRDALGLAARGGRVVLLGSMRGMLDGFDPYADVHRKGVTLVGAHASTQPEHANLADRWTEKANRALALELIASGDLPVKRLISHRLPKSSALEALELLAQRRANAVVLSWT
jgi:L-iditol 2-dehydrogenase